MLLIEIQCKGWEHNRVNAGIIELCHRTFPNERIKLYAETEHIANICELTSGLDNYLYTKEIYFGDWRNDCFIYRDKYEEVLERVIIDEKEEKNIIILSCNKGIIEAATNISKKYNNKSFFIVLHAALEEVVSVYHFGIRERLYHIFSFIKSVLYEKKIDYIPSMKDCINRCRTTNSNFILFAPRYREYLKTKIREGILERFVFINHPLYDSEENIRYDNNEIVIGIYGQAVNKNAYDIISCYNSKYDTGRVRFMVMAKEDDEILKLRNVVRLFEKDFVSNEDLVKARQGFDYVMIPYDHNQYKVTASGILCDALSEEIPVLMLDSPLLDYYNQYGIGVLEKSIEEMADRIARLSLNNDCSKRFIEAEHRLKETVTQENCDIFRRMIGSA